jgi:1A family penicillin-binding protein
MRVAVVAVAALLVLAASGAFTGYAVAMSWLEDLPDYQSAEAFELAQPTKIYSADGVLLARLFLENRTTVPMSEIATDLADAIVAIEDERFYQHDGVDYLGIARAAFKDVIAGDFDEGASTITQQYIDNTVLRDERTDRTLRYKAREAYLALELEKLKSKEEILGLYLNAIYLGDGAYGAQAAAHTYFAKDAKDLTLPEAATLAALAQAPSRLNPYDNPEGATQRRNLVLGRMLANNFITQTEHDEAIAAPMAVEGSEEPEGGIYQAHYFVAHVKKVLQQEYSQSLVFQGGLTVYTTLDTRLQGYAEDAVFSRYYRDTDPNCALVSIDHTNGHVVAMVGGDDFSENKFNLATQGRRQPGSAFKMFVLVTALEDGMPPSRYVDSSSPAVIPTNPPWVVSNSEGYGRGMITMRAGTRGSVNTVFARLIFELGADKVAATARRMGITSDVPAYPSIALGTHNVSVIDMASAFGTLANLGTRNDPVVITKVLDRAGETVFESTLLPQEVVSPEIAYAAINIMKGVITGGTARRANIGRPAAGKTGTSQNYRDAWFCGFTPQLTTAVWTGYYERETSMRNVNGVRGFGGTLSAPVWADYMSKALEGLPAVDWPRQETPDYRWKSAWAATQPTTSYLGFYLESVLKDLNESGFKIVIGEQYHPNALAGVVIGQVPAPGDPISPGAALTLTVSKGPIPAPPPPPSVPTTGAPSPPTTGTP